MRFRLWFLLLVACPDAKTIEKTPPKGRAVRRAYDGAPPVIPHQNVGADCTRCHNREGLEVPGLGFSPPSPHAKTAGLSDLARCRQCHVFRVTGEVFKQSEFVGMPQNLRRGARLYASAPPVIPHDVWMRENCAACHTGKAARESIRTSHPERTRCRQCHLEQKRGAGTFARGQTTP